MAWGGSQKSSGRSGAELVLDGGGRGGVYGPGAGGRGRYQMCH